MKILELRKRGRIQGLPNLSGTPYYLRNGKSYGFQIWPVHSEDPSEQKPIKNFREKGAWAYPGTAQFSRVLTAALCAPGTLLHHYAPLEHLYLLPESRCSMCSSKAALCAPGKPLLHVLQWSTCICSQRAAAPCAPA